MDFHVKIKGLNKSDPSPALVLFHRTVKAIDGDWPFTAMVRETTISGKTEKKIEASYKVCKKCKCRIWRMPRLGPKDLKTLSKQLKVRIKISRFAPETLCTEVEGGKAVVKWEMQTTDKPVEI